MKTFLSTITFCILLSFSIHGMFEKFCDKLCDELYLNESYNKTHKSSSNLKKNLTQLKNNKLRTNTQIQSLLKDTSLEATQKIKQWEDLELQLTSTKDLIKKTKKEISEQEIIENNVFDLRNYFECPAIFACPFAFVAVVSLATAILEPQKALPLTLALLLALSPIIIFRKKKIIV